MDARRARGNLVSDISARQVAAATLASLPRITCARLRALLEGFDGDPERALGAVRNGTAGAVLAAAGIRRASAVAERWRDAVPDARVAAFLARRGTHVWLDADDDFPIRDDVPQRPAVLLGEGNQIDVFDMPRVAIVGTRAATPQGVADAREIAGFCVRAGIAVVSGLAIGIDAAAHEGALAAGGAVVGVVATGLDVVYPRRHDALFARVRERGCIVSEQAYGVQPLPELFPERNRIIAALADAVIVVEATVSGGANITARYAAEYGRQVYALPGSRRNPAAAGCNALIADGAKPLLEPGDVLFEYGALGTVAGGWTSAAKPPQHPDDAFVLHCLAGDPASIDEVERTTGLPADRLGPALRRLEQSGHLERKRGLWWPR
jgi:DNA processing protein